MRRFTQEEVDEYFTKQGYLITGKYEDIKTKIAYVCPLGHHGEMAFDNFKRGNRCPLCRIAEASERHRHSLGYVQSYFKQHHCVLQSDKYINRKQKLSYICNCGNFAMITFNDFSRGRRCGICAKAKRIVARKRMGLIPVSSQQLYIHKLVGGELNYVVKTVALDIAFPEKMIYIEYDGSGHNLSVKKKTITQNEFDKKQMRRNYALYRAGWKCIRIISRKDKLPTDEVLLKHIGAAYEKFKTGASYYEIDIDNQTIEYSQKTFDVDFGELRRVKNS